MPKKTEKQELSELLLVIGVSGLCCPKLKIYETEDILTLMSLLEICRYTSVRTPVPKSTNWLETVLCSADYNDARFRGQLRMERAAFCQLVEMIKGNFAYNMYFVYDEWRK